MNGVASIVGSIVAEVAASALSSTSGQSRPAIRVSGFDESEIVAMVSALDALATSAAKPVTVKVGTSRPVAGLEKHHLLAEDETLTHWRNADVPALVLIDLEVQGDEEGLAAIHRMDDRSILEDEDEELSRHRLSLVVKHAWAATGRGEAPPGRLETCLASVRQGIAGAQNLSLRRWAQFVSAACTGIASGDLMTPDVVDRAVGQNLGIIKLFPDPDLFSDEGNPRSRLSRNLRVSELRQPNGAAINEDDLIARIAGVPLSDDLLEARGMGIEEARTAMRGVVHGGGPSDGCGVDLALWLELFERRIETAGLGQMVREHIAGQAPGRVPELDSLEVEEGLDQSDQESAETLVRAEPPQGELALIDLLTKSLRRRVEKLAFPDAQPEEDPLRALLHALDVLEDVEGDAAYLSVEGTAGEWSIWLFAFLYGATLNEVAEQSTGGSRELHVDSRLLTAVRPPLEFEEQDFDVTTAWPPLRLTIDIAGRAKRRFRWDPQAQPGLVAFAALIGLDIPLVGTRVETDLDAYCERFLDPRAWDETPSSAASSDGAIIRQLSETRSSMLKVLRDGLAADPLDEYFSAWSSQVERARDTLVPRNAPIAELADVVLSDVVEFNDGHLAMLGVHPLRLRWVAQHLRRMTELLTRCLAGGLRLNPENSELFFEWLDRAAPHGTPPLVVGEDETVAISAREVGWHEEYVPVRRGGSETREWASSVDDAAIDELVGVIGSYVDTYPYKRDGLVVLLLNRDGGTRLPLRLTQRLRARFSGLRVELHVLSPRASHHDLVQTFEDAFTEDVTDDRLFPDVQLVVHDWELNQEPELTDLRDRVDVALAPALFGARTSLNRLTRDKSAGLSGTYNAWLHAATHDANDSSQNVVRLMLPQQKDPVLETWSTLCVRHDAHSAVAPEQDENTDYFALQVRFDRHQRLFADLHTIAHWVVTLDAFVGRDQIDQLSERPDVILVRTGVGKNQAYTLIVSSDTGRRFVVQRLISKLRYDLGLGDDPPLEAVADRFYDVGRNVVPGAVLRALGLGRAASEVVGLVASRFEVAQRFPVDEQTAGMEVWVSFDDHQGWFGRSQRMRADLGRFLFTIDDESGLVRLKILVIESKFRQNLDIGSAEQQLDRTTELCRSAFGSGDGSGDDAEFWLQELAAAVEQTSRLTVPDADLPARRLVGPPRVGVEMMVLQSLRSGAVVLDDVDGVAVAIAARADDPAPEISSLGSHSLLRLNRKELERVVSDLLAHTAPGADGFGHAEIATKVDADSSAIASNEGAGAAQPPDSGLSPDSRHGEAAPSAVSGSSHGLGEETLRGRYERLLDVLRHHSVLVDPPPTDAWKEGPGFYILRVVPRPGVTVDRVSNRVDEIALSLALPEGARIRASLDRGAIAFEIPKTAEERYPVLAEEMWSRSPVADDRLLVPVGEDVSGDILSLEFSSPDSPHLLVAGTTGSGKSVALEALLRGLCRYPSERLRLHLVDPKGTELLDFEDDPHVEGLIGMDAADALSILDGAVAEMQSRYEVMKTVRARNLPEYNARVSEQERLPWRVIVLDEYADLTSDPDDKAGIEQRLRRLTQKARAAGIHVIAATQRPSADVVSTTIRSNFPAQLALRVKTATDSRIVMDEGGAETLAGQGDAFLKTARGTTRLQVAWVAPS